jgi:hypothetical protein
MGNSKGFQTRLTEEQKSEIRRLYESGVHHGEIVSRFKCSESAFWLIVRGLRNGVRQRAWAELESRLRGLPKEKLGWVAGIVDGEGYVGLGKHGERWVNPRVSVASATRCMQEELVALVGVGTIGFRPNKKKKQRDCFVWQLHTAQEVGGFLSAVGNLLVVKRDVASIVLGFCRTRLEDGVPLLRLQVKDLMARVRGLNKRGRR